MTRPIAPCKNCPDRTVDPKCHDQCEKFANWKASHQKEQAAKTAWRNQLREDHRRIEKRSGYEKRMIGGEQ